MSKLEVSARMTIRAGKLEDFKRQAAECIRQTKEKDTKTLRYDWFINDPQTECEIRELYESAEGLVEHRMHIGEALDKLFSEFADLTLWLSMESRLRNWWTWRSGCLKEASSGIPFFRDLSEDQSSGPATAISALISTNPPYRLLRRGNVIELKRKAS